MNATEASGSFVLFTVTGTIELTTPLPEIIHDIHLLGPGPEWLEVKCSEEAEPFRIFQAKNNVRVTIDGLRVVDGQGPDVSGVVFRDTTTNGRFDEGEDILPNWTVLLYEETNDVPGLQTEGVAGDTLLDSQTTGVEGDYHFDDLLPGSYHVLESLQADWIPTTDNPATDLDQTIQGPNFGNLQLNVTSRARPASYWASVEGITTVTQDDMKAITSLHLRNADDTPFQFTHDPNRRAGRPLSQAQLNANQDQFAMWLQDNFTSGMAHRLSVQLATMQLNVLKCSVPANQFVDISTVAGHSQLADLPTYYSFAGHVYVQISVLIQAAVVELSSHLAADSTDDRWTYQEALRNVFESLNNDLPIYVY
jgi:hypothetical protein